MRASPIASRQATESGENNVKKVFELRLCCKVFFCRLRSGLNKNSPALQRWGCSSFGNKSVKRTTEEVLVLRYLDSAVRFTDSFNRSSPNPTDSSGIIYLIHSRTRCVK